MPAPAKPVSKVAPKTVPSKVETVVEAPAPVPVAPVVVEAPAPVVAETPAPKPKAAPRPRKVAAKVEETPAPEPVVEVPPMPLPEPESTQEVVDEESEDASAPKGRKPRRRYTPKDVATESVTLQKRIAEEVEKLSGQKVKHRSLLISLRKDVEKINSMLKHVKGGRVAPVQTGNSTALKKNLRLSDAGADFLGVAKGSEYTRNDMTKAVCAYVEEKGLKMEGKRTHFRLDSKLAALFPVRGQMERKDKESGEKRLVDYDFEKTGMSFLDLQSLLKHCFA
jgi:chromatin remodeling complex protein RSC6